MCACITGTVAPRRHTVPGLVRADVEVGWQQRCDCAAGIKPCTVLDPFTGAGTTGLAAALLGRGFIGIELNPEYAAMARKRISESMPLFVRAAGGQPC